MQRSRQRRIERPAGKDACARGGDTSSRASERQWLWPCITAEMWGRRRTRPHGDGRQAVLRRSSSRCRRARTAWSKLCRMLQRCWWVRESFQHVWWTCLYLRSSRRSWKSSWSSCRSSLTVGGSAGDRASGQNPAALCRGQGRC